MRGPTDQVQHVAALDRRRGGTEAVLALQRGVGNRSVARLLARQPAITAPAAPAAAPPEHQLWAEQTTEPNIPLAQEIDRLEQLSADAFLRERDIVELRASTYGPHHDQDVRELEAIEFIATNRKIVPHRYIDPYKHDDQNAVDRLNTRLVIEAGIRENGSLKQSMDEIKRPKYNEHNIWAIESEAHEFGEEFKRQAKDIAVKMLGRSLNEILTALQGYGFDRHWADVQARNIAGGRDEDKAVQETVDAPGVWEGGSLEHSDANAGRASKHRTSLAAYVTNLRAQQRIVDDRRKDMAKWFRHSSQMGDYVPDENQAGYHAAWERFDKSYKRLAAMWTHAEKVHPVLASFRGQHGQAALDMVDLGALDSGQSAAQMKDVLASVLPKAADIYRIYARIQSGDLSPLTLPPVVAMTKAAMLVPEGSIRAGKVKDMVEEARDTKVSTYIAEGLLALIALALVIPTGGASLGIPIALVGVGLSATTAYEDWQTYKQDKMLANSALDRAKALSVADPSLVPFIFDLITLGLDGAALLKAVRELVALRNAVRAGEDASEIDKAVKQLDMTGDEHGAPDLGKKTLHEFRAAEADATVGQRAVRPPPGQPYWTVDELRAAVRRDLAKLRGGRKKVNSEWARIMNVNRAEHLARYPDDRWLFEVIDKVWKARRDPERIERLIVKLWMEAGENGISPQKQLIRHFGGPEGMPRIPTDVDDDFFRKALLEDKPSIDLAFLRTDHGVLIHMFDEYLVEDVLGSRDLAMRFRKAIANAGGGDAAGARKRVKELGGQMIEIEFYRDVWDALFDAYGQGQINRAEELGNILIEHLGFAGRARPPT